MGFVLSVIDHKNGLFPHVWMQISKPDKAFRKLTVSSNFCFVSADCVGWWVSNGLRERSHELSPHVLAPLPKHLCFDIVLLLLSTMLSMITATYFIIIVLKGKPLLIANATTLLHLGKIFKLLYKITTNYSLCF